MQFNHAQYPHHAPPPFHGHHPHGHGPGGHYPPFMPYGHHPQHGMPPMPHQPHPMHGYPQPGLLNNSCFYFTFTFITPVINSLC